MRKAPGKGRGVFAGQPFAEGEVIERVPVVVLPREQRRFVDATVLWHYYFKWPPHDGVLAFPLGHAMIYNHSGTPNAVWHGNPDENLMDFVAVRPIAAGEEITHNYGGPKSQMPMWFELDEGPLRRRRNAVLRAVVRARGTGTQAEADAGDRLPHYSEGERHGVWTQRALAAGEVIERAPVIAIPPHEAWVLSQTDLAPYLIAGRGKRGSMAFPLGLAPMCSHSDEPNAALVPSEDDLVVDVIATRPIVAEGEVLVGWPERHADETGPLASMAEKLLGRVLR